MVCVGIGVGVGVFAAGTAVVGTTTIGNGMQRIAGEGNACVENKRGEGESKVDARTHLKCTGR